MIFKGQITNIINNLAVVQKTSTGTFNLNIVIIIIIIIILILITATIFNNKS